MDFEKHLYGYIVMTDVLGGRVRNLRAESRAARLKEQELERLKRAFGLLGGGGAGGMAPLIPTLETSVGFAKRMKQSIGYGPPEDAGDKK